MTSLADIEPAFDALDRCVGALGILDARCCDPGRSPRLAELGNTLTEARVKLRAVTIQPDVAGSEAIHVLESAGAQVGQLQVGCCAPDRMPLYAEILENPTVAQMTVAQMLNG
ncbi:MAG: hypothetical protein GY722_27960 [bacterium]|nr:hypothetical protein [bacterium]